MAAANIYLVQLKVACRALLLPATQYSLTMNKEYNVDFLVFSSTSARMPYPATAGPPTCPLAFDKGDPSVRFIMHS